MPPLSSLLARTRHVIRSSVEGVLYSASGRRGELDHLRDQWKGQPTLVVGNGPSLNNTPLDQFPGIPSIGMNKISMLFDRTTWRPNFTVTCNTLVVRQHWRDFVDAEIPSYVSWKNRWMVPRKRRGDLRYFYETPSTAFSKNLPQGIGTWATVTYACLQFAYFMGSDPVILFGVDHSFKTEGPANKIETRKGDDVNHFDPNYFAAGMKWGVPNLDGSERAFLLAREAFEADGRRVLDATIGGKLDIFPKISVDEAMELCSLKTQSKA